jgi:hypothetical protein
MKKFDPMEIDDDKYPLFETKWFNCDCYDAHHAVRFTYDREYGDLNFEFRINNYKSFWSRLKAAYKYLFNRDNKDCCYDSFIVRKDEAQAMIAMLEKVVKYDRT